LKLAVTDPQAQMRASMQQPIGVWLLAGLGSEEGRWG